MCYNNYIIIFSSDTFLKIQGARFMSSTEELKAETLQAEALKSNAWPFVEARALLKKLNNKLPEKGFVAFQTGYGPSGLPHLGTFGENSRTTMVMRAFNVLSDMPTKLIAFSDDMDGFRKVPTNVPNQEELANYIGMPLTKVKDPFGTHDSFGEHNNARLQVFLDQFNFKYEFMSSTKCYKSGMFDDVMLQILENYDKIKNVILPTLGEERRETYSPFLPVDEKSGKVLQAKVISTNKETGSIVYLDEDNNEVETKVTGGRCKMQWKVDWAMRWAGLEIDYEMCGKDLSDSVTLSSKIVRILGKKPPQNLIYELFLDSKGEKISKSKGNGLSMDEWLRYGITESLSLFMYQKPKTAKRLHFDIIPKTVDEYLQHLKAYADQDPKAKLNNPVYHIHNGDVPTNVDVPVTYSLLLNLASVVNADDKEILWSFIKRYAKDATPQNNPILNKLSEFAVVYYQDFVKPNKKYVIPKGQALEALKVLKDQLQAYTGDETDGKEIQSLVFSVGKENGYAENLKDWFKVLYECLLGQETGPRMGGFFAIFGKNESIKLIENAILGKLS